MSVQNILLLLAGLINLTMSILVFSRGVKHNKINFYFSLLTFFNFLWALNLIVINLGINYELTRFMASLVYPVALMIVVILFYFIIHFPYKLLEIPKIYKLFINLSILFYSIFCIFFYQIFVWKVSLGPKVIIYYEFISYSIYTFILIILMLAGIVILFLKLKKAEAAFKQQLCLVLLAVIIGTVMGSYSNLFLMYFHNLDYNHFGPLFTLVINFIAFYLIFLKGKINNK
ncbi:MAG: hypothetical protein WCV71_00410 [Patescibacteria group bacterium]|jgi:hypothetical protein